MTDLKQKPFYGITQPISLTPPSEKDTEISAELERCLLGFNLFEPQDMLDRRIRLLNKLNDVLKVWVEDMSVSKQIPEHVAKQTNGKIFTFGSYRLGVHPPGADIDTLIVAPRHIERSDFFSSFGDYLQRHFPTCEYIHPVEEAFVPVMKTKIDGIEIDILYSRLALKTIPFEQELSDGKLLMNLDEKSVRSLNGCRVTDDILNLVPNHESFRLALRAIKWWAKCRGIYSNSLGYLGGVSWAMLVARTCQLYPNASASTLVQKLFLLFKQWPWPKPVLLRHNSDDDVQLGFPVWNPVENPGDRFHLMPIITPSYPQQNSTYNVTNSTKEIITEELAIGIDVIEKIFENKTSWETLFEPIPFFHKYRHFLCLIISDTPEWSGLVESKIRTLVQSLERHKGIEVVQVFTKCFKRDNPKYSKTSSPTVAAAPAVAAAAADSADDELASVESEEAPSTKNVKEQIMWFIGLRLNRNEAIALDFTNDGRVFLETVRNIARNAKFFNEDLHHINIEYVKKKDLDKYLPEPEMAKVKATLQRKTNSNDSLKKRKSEGGNEQNGIKQRKLDSKTVARQSSNGSTPT